MKVHPFIPQIKARIREQKSWSIFALWPNRKRKPDAPKRVYIITRNERRFAAIAEDQATAERIIGEVEQ